MVHIITGPPCAGKSTFIKEHAKPGDLIVDYDVIAQALGSKESHHVEGFIRKAAFIARQAVINEALSNTQYESWIIHTIPSQDQLQRYRKIGAEIVVLDPGYNEVKSRAIRDQRPSNTFEGIEKWYKIKAGITNHQGSKVFNTRQKEIIFHMTDRMKNNIGNESLINDDEGIGKQSRNW